MLTYTKLGADWRLGLHWVPRPAWISDTSKSQKDFQNVIRADSIGIGPSRGI